MAPTTTAFVLLYFILFLIGAVLGYVLEVFFRRFFSAKKWVNPGFLAGPWLPLYGFGVLVMLSFTLIFINVLPENMPIYNPIGNFEFRPVSGPTVYDLIPISCIAVSLIALEFIAGVVFVKGFKVRLWDYTNMKGNVMGIICPVFNIIWASIAVIYYYGLSPFIYEMAKGIGNFLFGSGEAANASHSSVIFAVGILYGFFIIDLVKSLNLFHKVRKLVDESGVGERYEHLKAKQKQLGMVASARLYEAMPESLKAQIEKMDASRKNKAPSRFKVWLANLILVDPSKTKTEGNYDASGRPIKEEETNQ